MEMEQYAIVLSIVGNHREPKHTMIVTIETKIMITLHATSEYAVSTIIHDIRNRINELQFRINTYEYANLTTPINPSNPIDIIAYTILNKP